MINSMTGFGRAEKNANGLDITVEIKAVNHRYFEYSSRLPRAYGFLDEKIKNTLQQYVKRGKVEVAVTVAAQESTAIQINEALALQYVQALRIFGERANVPDDLGLAALSRLNDIYIVKRVGSDEEALWQEVAQVLETALMQFLTMRRVEGENLLRDVTARMDILEAHTRSIEEQAPQRVAEYRKKLHNKLLEVLAGTAVEEQRILTEAAIYAEKIAVDEETTRLHSHFAQFRAILKEENAVGRKLDFLVQEMNREVNTVGSKAQDTAIANLVITMKAEMEKIREQIQNIE